MYTSIKKRVPLRVKVFVKSIFVPVVARDPNPFATHIPIMIGLGAHYPIRRVLEFGAGNYSTLLFLDRRAFPQLETLVSYETDEAWLTRVQQACADDTRVTFVLTESMVEAAKAIDYSAYDLIFIDDSLTVEARAQTIAAVTSQRETINGLVVIHDYEQKAYQQAAKAFENQYAFRIFNPQVGVLWQTPASHQMKLIEIARTVKRHAPKTAAESVSDWLRVFTLKTSR